MRITAKERERRSKLRQELNVKLNVWLQRVKDMQVLQRDPGNAEKITFVQQEIVKIEKELHDLDFGFRYQRAWVKGPTKR